MKCTSMSEKISRHNIATRGGGTDIRWGSLDRGHQMRVGSSKIAIFASYGHYVFPKFIYETKIFTSEYVD